MKDPSKFASLLIFVAAASASYLTAATDAPDVTGTWTMSVETSFGAGSPTFTLIQKGEEVTGNYKGRFGEATVSGTIKGNEITISFKTSGQGQEMKIDYIGTVEGDTMKGKVVFGEFGEGTFKGTREQPQQQ